MKKTIYLRWAFTAPVALMSMYLMQVLVFIAAMLIFQAGFAEQPEWVRWAAKSIATPFMACAFVYVTWWMAPSRKNLMSLIALFCMILWGGMLIYGFFVDQVQWLLFMGSGGILGGMIGCLLPHASFRDVG